MLLAKRIIADVFFLVINPPWEEGQMDGHSGLFRFQGLWKGGRVCGSDQEITWCCAVTQYPSLMLVPLLITSIRLVCFFVMLFLFSLPNLLLSKEGKRASSPAYLSMLRGASVVRTGWVLWLFIFRRMKGLRQMKFCIHTDILLGMNHSSRMESKIKYWMLFVKQQLFLPPVTVRYSQVQFLLDLLGNRCVCMGHGKLKLNALGIFHLLEWICMTYVIHNFFFF